MEIFYFLKNLEFGGENLSPDDNTFSERNYQEICNHRCIISFTIKGQGHDSVKLLVEFIHINARFESKTIDW